MGRVVGTTVLATIAVLAGLLARRAPSPIAAGDVPADRRDEAIAYFERALARDPANPMLKGQLIGRLIARFGQTADLSDVGRAELLATSALGLMADRSAGLARLSGIYLMQHKFAAAFETAEAAVAADSGSTAARGALLEAAVAAGRYPVAEAQLSRLDDGSVSGQVRRALWLDQTGHGETAERLLTTACRTLARSASGSQGPAWCLTQLANVVHGLRGPREARRILESVERLSPGYRGAVEGLANLALAEGRPAEALAAFNAIRSEAHPDIDLRIAEAHTLLGQPDLARAAERRFLAVAGGPANEPLFGHPLALYYAERGGPRLLDSALAIAEREVARRPTTESFDLLAWVHFRRGAYPEALDASDRALAWGSPTPTMSYHRARILEAAGRTTEAAELLATAAQAPTLLAPHARRGLRSDRGSAS
ncbi:MAG: tetratricopeptide repeat protein [Gemmatimonadetes bacterium]|nr:tetratricopeptide repeat protein [Gemmatimonadota bacterium]